jgi:uncharacterized protein YaiI (UPF0178 family)
LKIWIDADACPKVIKEVVFKISSRDQLPICLVANANMHIPASPFISLIQVDKGSDVADKYIVDHVEKDDLVITADIPLADLVVKKGAMAINPRGELYTEENISERLSMRDFMKELRDSGMQTGGPEIFSPKDKELFTNSIHRILTKLKKHK